MPSSVRCVHFAGEGVELTKLAEITDRILDHSTQSQVMAMEEKVSHQLPLSSAPFTFQRKDLLTWRKNSVSLLLPSRIHRPR